MNTKLIFAFILFASMLNITDKNDISIDPKEFAPNHPNVQMMPNEQLYQFPIPRYKFNHTLLRNYDWMGLNFIGGLKKDGISKETNIKNATAFQEELALNWNYYIHIGNARIAFYDLTDEPNGNRQTHSFVKLANKYPEIPVAVTTFWAQIDLTRLGDSEGRPYVMRQNLPENYYLEGAVRNNRKVLSPSAPGDLFKKDGNAQKVYLEKIISVLTRPIDMINENGEVRPNPMRSIVSNDYSNLKTDFKAHGNNDWQTYQAEQKLRFRNIYSDEFLKRIPALQNTMFTWYAIDGQKEFRFKYSVSRKATSKIKGQYYSTPDFYPRWPANWNKWKGAWRGWKWLRICRPKEIENGDKLFSPFVAAGWDIDPERNVRPSQWLGLLKNLGVIGAEFMYTGFFNESWSGKDPRANPKNYIWQAAMPSYAQAITSHYEDILRNGSLLKNKHGKALTNLYCSDPDLNISVRKHDTKKQYIIAGSVQPDSNNKGDVPDEKTIETSIDGFKIKLNFRRQGSVYFLDITDEQNPIFYQLDAWHETGHPIYWSEDFVIDAEVYDDAKNISITTESKTKHDFSSFTSFVSPRNKEAELSYYFHPRKTSNFHLAIKARSSVEKTKNKIEVYLNDILVETINANKTTWEGLCLKSKDAKINFKNISAEQHKLTLKLFGKTLQVDKIKLTKEK